MKSMMFVSVGLLWALSAVAAGVAAADDSKLSGHHQSMFHGQPFTPHS